MSWVNIAKLIVKTQKYYIHSKEKYEVLKKAKARVVEEEM